MNRGKIRVFWVLFGLVVFLAVPSLMAQNITQTYDADSTLQRGMIVALDKESPTKVEAANLDRVDEIHGVVVAGNDASISISQEDQKTYVATTGRFEVLVSDINGEISAGDYVTASSVSGIGQKADESQSTVVGKSVEGFSGQNSDNFVSQTTVKDGEGKDVSIALGRVVVDISVGKNPLAKDINTPFILKKIGEQVAGGTVSSVQLYLALFVLVTATAVSGGIIYNSVRSGLIAMGRNPLSKSHISRAMFQMVLIGFVVFFSALFGVYLILKI